MDKAVWFDLARRMMSRVDDSRFGMSQPKWRVDKTALAANILRVASSIADERLHRSSPESAVAEVSGSRGLPFAPLSRGPIIRVGPNTIDSPPKTSSRSIHQAAAKGQETLAAVTWIGILIAFVFRFFVNERHRVEIKRKASDILSRWQEIS